jgi:hypothetical protein
VWLLAKMLRGLPTDPCTPRNYTTRAEPRSSGGGSAEGFEPVAADRAIVRRVAYSTSEGRQQLLDSLAEAIDEIAFALAALGAAYEQLDVATADKLEQELFGPAQRAYGRAQRTYAAFAERAALEARPFEPQEAGLPSTGAKGFVDEAVDAIGAADGKLATLQDSPMLLEVGDVELRGGLAEIRELIGGLPHAARELLRRLGR